MLPDYPGLKRSFNKYFDRFFRERLDERLGITSLMSQRAQLEGNTWSLHRKPGDEERRGFESTEAGFKISFEEIPQLSLADVLTRLAQSAEEMAKQISIKTFGRIDETLKTQGREFDARGRPPSADLLLEMLERTEMSFERGQPNLHLMVHPSMQEAMNKAAADLMQDEDANRRYKELMAKKWEEWVARESDRGLDG